MAIKPLSKGGKVGDGDGWSERKKRMTGGLYTQENRPPDRKMSNILSFEEEKAVHCNR